jgi:hypothetical protein
VFCAWVKDVVPADRQCFWYLALKIIVYKKLFMDYGAAMNYNRRQFIGATLAASLAIPAIALSAKAPTPTAPAPIPDPKHFFGGQLRTLYFYDNKSGKTFGNCNNLKQGNKVLIFNTDTKEWTISQIVAAFYPGKISGNDISALTSSGSSVHEGTDGVGAVWKVLEKVEDKRRLGGMFSKYRTFHIGKDGWARVHPDIGGALEA